MIKRFLIMATLVLVPAVALPVATVNAVDVLEPGVCEKYKGKSANEKPAVCQDNNTGGENPLFGPKGILTSVLNVLSIIVGIVAVIVIILAGLKFITSGTNPQDVANAREQIIYACVALVIAAMAQALVRFILGRIGT